jgi:hypothetical protein
VPTKEKVTEEARGYLERVEVLKRQRDRVADEAYLGDAEAGVRLPFIDREIKDLEARAESVRTLAKLKATQERNAREIQEQEKASQRARMRIFVEDEITRYRSEELSSLGLVVIPTRHGGWQATLPVEEIVRRAQGVEVILGSTRFGSDNPHRRMWMDQNGFGELLSLTYDEAAETYFDAPARFIRDLEIDSRLGVRMEKDGSFKPAVIPKAPDQDSDGPSVPYLDT